MEYRKTEFRKLVVQGGYASSKTVTYFYKLHPERKTFTEEDLIEVYRLDGYYSSIKRTTKRKG